MHTLTKEELKDVNGGGVGAYLVISGIVVFVIGVIDGFLRPLKCR